MERNDAPWVRLRALQFTESDATKPRPAPFLWRVHAAWLVLKGRAEIVLWTDADRESWRDAIGAPTIRRTRSGGPARPARPRSGAPGPDSPRSADACARGGAAPAGRTSRPDATIPVAHVQRLSR